MNERIQELVERAGGHFGKGLEFAVVFGELDDFKKFAELIVRECAGIAHGSDMPGKDIKEHFGVEQ
jgi:GGDEF domain-containing protein